MEYPLVRLVRCLEVKLRVIGRNESKKNGFLHDPRAEKGKKLVARS